MPKNEIKTFQHIILEGVYWSLAQNSYCDNDSSRIDGNKANVKNKFAGKEGVYYQEMRCKLFSIQ